METPTVTDLQWKRYRRHQSYEPTERQNAPTVQDVKNLNKVVTELKQTKGLKITIPELEGPLKLVSICDASFGNRRGEPSFFGYLTWLAEVKPRSKWAMKGSDNVRDTFAYAIPFSRQYVTIEQRVEAMKKFNIWFDEVPTLVCLLKEEYKLTFEDLNEDVLRIGHAPGPNAEPTNVRGTEHPEHRTEHTPNTEPNTHRLLQEGLRGATPPRRPRTTTATSSGGD